jgi:hypothetical protein
MIIALTGTDDHAASDLAQQLALLRTAAGASVLLMSAAYAQRMRRSLRYDDIVISAANGAMALSMAGVIVVLVRPADLQEQNQGALQARIRHAIELNPRARVLVSVAHGARELSPQEVGNILVFVAQMKSARLADRLVLDEDGVYHTRHSVLAHAGDEDEESLCAPEVRYLYRQIFHGAQPE